MEITIRKNVPNDIAGIRAVNDAAFKDPAEGELSERLLRSGCFAISLVAELGSGEIAGFILFTPVTINGFSDRFWLGLGPLAVLPDYQNQKIGSQLVPAGLELCEAAGAQAVFVQGHPAYYPRFGFIPTGRYAIDCEFKGPPEAFMVKELVVDTLDGVSGVVEFMPVFRELFPNG